LAFFLAGGVISCYVYGAVWNDKNIISSCAGKTEASQALTRELVGGATAVDDPDKP